MSAVASLSFHRGAHDGDAERACIFRPTLKRCRGGKGNGLASPHERDMGRAAHSWTHAGLAGAASGMKPWMGSSAMNETTERASALGSRARLAEEGKGRGRRKLQRSPAFPSPRRATSFPASAFRFPSPRLPTPTPIANTSSGQWGGDWDLRTGGRYNCRRAVASRRRSAAAAPSPDVTRRQHRRGPRAPLWQGTSHPPLHLSLSLSLSTSFASITRRIWDSGLVRRGFSVCEGPFFYPPAL